MGPRGSQDLRSPSPIMAPASDPHESKRDIGQWANFVTASEQKAIKVILIIFTSKFQTFDVVLNLFELVAR